MAVKGVGGLGRPLVGKPSRSNKEGAIVIPLGVDDAKRIIYDRLEVKDPGVKYRHLNRVATDEYLRQLTAEEKVRILEKGQPKLVWRLRRGQRRNEALDLTVYSLCAFRSLNANRPRVAASLQKVDPSDQAPPTPGAEPDKEVQASTGKKFTRKSTFVTAWRRW
jgi:phage terminase large subunit GpA-like protein